MLAWQGVYCAIAGAFVDVFWIYVNEKQFYVCLKSCGSVIGFLHVNVNIRMDMVETTMIIMN